MAPWSASNIGDAARSTRLYARQSQLTWSQADQAALAMVVNVDGSFNGTCSSDRQLLPPQVDAGQCSSYYANITTYCCAAVGGSLVRSSQQGGKANGSDAVEANVTMIEPACNTTNFQDMLLCYMYTAEEHCRSAASGPWGICNTATTTADDNGNNGQSTTSTTNSSSSTSTDNTSSTPRAQSNGGTSNGAPASCVATSNRIVRTTIILLVLSTCAHIIM